MGLIAHRLALDEPPLTVNQRHAVGGASSAETLVDEHGAAVGLDDDGARVEEVLFADGVATSEVVPPDHGAVENHGEPRHDDGL